MSIFWWILIGLFVGIGWAAVLPGREQRELITANVVGIGGAIVGGGQMLGLYRETDPVRIVMLAIGSTAVVFIYRMISGLRS